MSGEGPDSIPTSADPRSRRPVKKRALTPVSAQAASVDALFARPDQEIKLPGANAGGALVPAAAHLPPEIVANVQGSSAGAGSGEFHVYKAARRREYERLRRMDDDVRRESADAEFERGRDARRAADEERTRRNREKRDRLKARKARARSGPAAPGTGDDAAEGEAGAVPDGKPASRPAGVAARRGLPLQDGDADDADERPVAGGEPVGLVIHDDD